MKNITVQLLKKNESVFDYRFNHLWFISGKISFRMISYNRWIMHLNESANREISDLPVITILAHKGQLLLEANPAKIAGGDVLCFWKCKGNRYFVVQLALFYRTGIFHIIFLGKTALWLWTSIKTVSKTTNKSLYNNRNNDQWLPIFFYLNLNIRRCLILDTGWKRIVGRLKVRFWKISYYHYWLIRKEWCFIMDQKNIPVNAGEEIR